MIAPAFSLLRNVATMAVMAGLVILFVLGIDRHVSTLPDCWLAGTRYVFIDSGREYYAE
jgi:hypothetical protein